MDAGQTHPKVPSPSLLIYSYSRTPTQPRKRALPSSRRSSDPDDDCRFGVCHIAVAGDLPLALLILLLVLPCIGAGAGETVRVVLNEPGVAGARALFELVDVDAVRSGFAFVMDAMDTMT